MSPQCATERRRQQNREAQRRHRQSIQEQLTTLRQQNQMLIANHGGTVGFGQPEHAIQAEMTAMQSPPIDYGLSNDHFNVNQHPTMLGSTYSQAFAYPNVTDTCLNLPPTPTSLTTGHLGTPTLTHISNEISNMASVDMSRQQSYHDSNRQSVMPGDVGGDGDQDISPRWRHPANSGAGIKSNDTATAARSISRTNDSHVRPQSKQQSRVRQREDRSYSSSPSTKARRTSNAALTASTPQRSSSRKLANSAGPDPQSTLGRTPMSSAASTSSSGANHSIRDATPVAGSRTPLRSAVINGHTNVVSVLISAGANIHDQDANGRTLLHECALRGLDDVAQVLVDEGADIEARDNDGCTPLQIAAAKGNPDIVGLLVRRGADFEASC